jgi:hypothetical protein
MENIAVNIGTESNGEESGHISKCTQNGCTARDDIADAEIDQHVRLQRTRGIVCYQGFTFSSLPGNVRQNVCTFLIL